MKLFRITNDGRVFWAFAHSCDRAAVLFIDFVEETSGSRPDGMFAIEHLQHFKSVSLWMADTLDALRRRAKSMARYDKKRGWVFQAEDRLASNSSG